MIKKKQLLSPGPTPVPEEVLQEAAKQIIHHRTPEFSKIFMDTIEGLKYVFQTNNNVFILASSGTGAMESAVVNLLSKGDRVISINGGKFGARWGIICRTYGIQVEEINLEWGAPLDTELLKEKLEEFPEVRAVFTTLCETSSGVVFDIETSGKMIAQRDTLLVVDGISGVGAVPCPMDKWNIDVLISSSQKAFMTPPGLAYISFSPKAQEYVKRSSLPKFYFDAGAALKSLKKETSPWTPAISLIRQQLKSLEIIRSITLEKLFKHHSILGEATRAGVKALGLTLLAEKPGNILTAVLFPEGIDGLSFMNLIHNKYAAYVAGSQEPYKGKFFRISHLGYMGGFDIITALSAVDMTLSEMGYNSFSGQAVIAAQNIIKENWK